MPNQDKSRNRGKVGTLSQPTGMSQNHTPSAVTPGQRRSLPGTKPALTMNPIDTDSFSKLVDRFDKLETAINEYKDNSNVLAERTHKDLTDIKELLQSTRDDYVKDHRQLLIMEQNLKIAFIQNGKLSERLNDIENHNKLCNIRLDGKVEIEGEDLKKYVNELALFLNPTSLQGPNLVSIYRIGKKNNFAGPANNTGRRVPRPRTIMIVFANIADRNTFYFSRMKLKGAQNYPNVYLNDDVSVETRKAREDFRSVAALARLKGADVKVHSDGVVLDGTKYKLTEPDTLPDCYSLAKAKTMEFGGEIFFHSQYSYLSNFYNAPILLNDQIHLSAEHLYQFEKCDAAGDAPNKAKILKATTPLEAKRIGDTVNETADWKLNKESIMTKIIDLKFNQNKCLADLLRNTGDKILNEATSNMYFGIGATLHSREIKDKSYKGLNKLGQILMSKREQLTNNQQADSI